MKTIIKSVIAVTAVCLLAGCETTGLSSRERAGASYPNYILSLQSGGTNAPTQKPVVPIRLAVAQVGESAPPETMLNELTAQPTLVAWVVALPLPGEPDNYSYYNYNQKTIRAKIMPPALSLFATSRMPPGRITSSSLAAIWIPGRKTIP